MNINSRQVYKDNNLTLLILRAILIDGGHGKMDQQHKNWETLVFMSE